MAINLDNDLGIFRYIIPCGLDGVEMTSVQVLTGEEADMDAAKKRLTELCVRQWATRADGQKHSAQKE